MKKRIIILLSILPLILLAQQTDSLQTQATSWQENDSIVMAPLKVKPVGAQTYDELTAPQSSLDLQNPDNVTTTVEYDPISGGYVVRTRLGEVEIATPYLMSAEEYQQYSQQQAIGQYWQTKISEVEHDNERKFDITDMKFNIGPADKVFGPGGVQLKMQGSAELLFGFKHQYVDNPALTERSRNNNIFDFDEKIQLTINGKVGDKLNMNMSYNTEASFDFDQQNLKLNFKGQEDDIIQSLEAGNVSMNLNSNLIQGSSALFGIKADLKFGKLKVQALVSQQNSESQSVSSKGGAQTTNFEVNIDNYDENRHFFLSYYFRNQYEHAMQSLPYIASGVTINRIEVWVTNKRGNYDQARNIIALTDLGEHDAANLQNQNISTNGARNPYNKANSLYETLIGNSNVRDIQQTNSVMQNMSIGMDLSEDYEKIESARLLNNGEYTLNSALGYISLKTSLNQDEVLAVAYEYTYAGQVYQVGEFSTDGGEATKAPNALLLKMLKSTNNSPTTKNRGTWDLMMKNVYSLGATQISSDKFELYVQYRNDSVGTEMQYLMEGDIKGKQLLRVMQLDRLDSRNNNSPDGRFDYVEGYTALSSSGRIIFPVLEPFGSHLEKAIGNPQLAEKYIYQELYDSTLVSAQELSEKNKFVLVGKYKGSSGNEIRLNAMNIPRGSVVVTAGGATLIENVDYTVDYTMGTVTILNQSIIDAGTNVDVKLENQALFSMQRKSLFGAHVEYDFNKDLTVGGTIMHLREKPLTTKVNTGSEPLANTIWGVNASWKTELQWLTLLLDKVPWIEASAPSTFQINAEFAHLIPGHTKEVGKVGTAYIDDFEATKTNIDIHYPSYWKLASTPTGDRYEEAKMSNHIDYNKNRALLAWYTVDPIFGIPQSNTPKHIKDNPDLMSDHRTRVVMEQEIYPDKKSLPNADAKLAVLNLSFYPDERGPYNISADEIGYDGKLTNPEKRWGGMMRKLDNTDFEKANIEYIEFWIMDPKLTNSDPSYEGGDLYIDLGDISEDILRDGKKSFEHGIPLNGDESMVDKTIWGISPKTTSTVVAFANEANAREKQDVGLNGLSSEDEMLFEYNGQKPYADYVTALKGKVDQAVLDMWGIDPFSPLNDPAGDNYHYYRGDDYDAQETTILERYKRYNGTEGNSPEMGQYDAYGTASTLQPDIEDINQDNTLNDNERFYRYHISLRPEDMRVGHQHIAGIRETKVVLRNKETADVTWYQFKIPLKGDSATMQKVGNIRNFKSIRFARIYMTNFKQETHLRLATLDLVRGEWRNYTKGLYQDIANNQYNISNPYTTTGSMTIEAVNIEENSTRRPVNYVLPRGISRQTDPGQAQLIEQNEQSMVFRFNHIAPKDARAVYKNVVYDMRQYKRLQMFVHAECQTQYDPIEDKDVSCFIRMGSDVKNNYYEYEIPLSLTPEGMYNNDNYEDRDKVWKNQFDFALSALTQAKMERNRAKRAGNSNVGNSIPYETYDPENLENKITIIGNPTLEDIQTIMIGIRNKTTHEVHGEVWVNELRLSEYNEQGGMAAMANAALSISDIAQVNVAGRLETAGYGSIESNVLDRNMEDMYQLSVSAALEAGRLFPEKAKLQIPLYVSYTNQTQTPDYDPLDTDVKLSETLESFDTKAEKDSIRSRAKTTHESTSFSVSNLKVDIHSKKRNMFYDPANFSISASYNEQNQYSPEIERDVTRDYKGSFNYSYNFNPTPWEPFKKVKAVQKIKLLSELNFYYLPQSWAFNTNMHRTFTHLKMRDFNTADLGMPVDNEMDLTFSKDFTWDRNFDFKYDLTKNLKFTFQTAMNSTVDEGYYTPEIVKDYAFTNDYYEAWKDTIQRSLATWGSPYTYQQLFSASWNVPFNRVPYIEAISANASYNATYNWNRTMQSSHNTSTNLGNVVSSTRAWQVDGGINFETLYGKSKYWKQMTQRFSQRNIRRRAFRPKTYTTTVSMIAGESKEITHRLGSEVIEVKATTTDGKKVELKSNPISTTKVSILSKEDIENLSITITTKDPNKRTPAQVTMDMAAYFGTMIRKVQVTYRNTSSLTVPGFAPQAGFMGQRRFNDMYAPGFDFAFGGFTDDFVQKAKNNGWLSSDTTVVQPATRSKTSDLDIKLVLEPFPGFKIQVNGKRYEAQSTSIIYSYDHLQENMTGSFNITQVAIGTAFKRIGNADDNFASETFNQFLLNRDVVGSRVQNQYRDVVYPHAGFVPMNLRGKAYDPQNGKVANNTADVLVPAFLSAYTGRDASSVGLNPFLGLLNILPNWSVTFDGLGRLPWMKDHFKSVNLTHAYTCKYAIGSYSSYSTWVPALGLENKQVGFVRDVTTDNPIPSSAYDISSVNLTESFSPLIGLNMTMKNSLSAKMEYRKQRSIALNVNSVQITEGHTNEFVIGAGYTIKDLSFISKTRGGGQKKVSNDLKINVDVSYKDIKTLLRKVEENITQASSGNKVFGIKISADYVLSQKINLQLFYDHQGTTPLISSSYPIKADNVGINIKLMLTR